MVRIADSRIKVKSLAIANEINSLDVFLNEVSLLLKTINLFVKKAKISAIINAIVFATPDRKAWLDDGSLIGILKIKQNNQ